MFVHWCTDIDNNISHHKCEFFRGVPIPNKRKVYKVCDRHTAQYIPIVYSVLERHRKKSYFMGMLLLLIRCGEVILRRRRQRSKTLGRKIQKSFVPIYSWKVDRLTSNQYLNDLCRIIHMSSNTFWRWKHIIFRYLFCLFFLKIVLLIAEKRIVTFPSSKSSRLLHVSCCLQDCQKFGRIAEIFSLQSADGRSFW